MITDYMTYFDVYGKPMSDDYLENMTVVNAVGSKTDVQVLFTNEKYNRVCQSGLVKPIYNGGANWLRELQQTVRNSGFNSKTENEKLEAIHNIEVTEENKSVAPMSKCTDNCDYITAPHLIQYTDIDGEKEYIAISDYCIERMNAVGDIISSVSLSYTDYEDEDKETATEKWHIISDQVQALKDSIEHNAIKCNIEFIKWSVYGTWLISPLNDEENRKIVESISSLFDSHTEETKDITVTHAETSDKAETAEKAYESDKAETADKAYESDKAKASEKAYESESAKVADGLTDEALQRVADTIIDKITSERLDVLNSIASIAESIRKEREEKIANEYTPIEYAEELRADDIYCSKTLEEAYNILNKYRRLLITGSTGEGKTELAHYIAYKITGHKINSPGEYRNICEVSAREGNSLVGSGYKKNGVLDRFTRYIQENNIEEKCVVICNEIQASDMGYILGDKLWEEFNSTELSSVSSNIYFIFTACNDRDFGVDSQVTQRVPSVDVGYISNKYKERINKIKALHSGKENIIDLVQQINDIEDYPIITIRQLMKMMGGEKLNVADSTISERTFKLIQQLNGMV